MAVKWDDLKRNDDPFLSYNFVVKVGTKKDKNKKTMVGSFSEFSGVNMTVETIQARSGNDRFGVQEYVPVLTRFEPVTLSRGVVRDNKFMDWLFSAAASLQKGPTGGEELYRDLEVMIGDGEFDTKEKVFKRNVTWTLQNALPIGYQLGAINANSNDIVVESMTFAITGISRECSG